MPATVEATVPVSYRAWQVPDHAVHVTPPGRRQDGFRPSPTTKVEDLDPVALERLCRAWVEELYSRAGKEPPRLMYE